MTSPPDDFIDNVRRQNARENALAKASSDPPKRRPVARTATNSGNKGAYTSKAVRDACERIIYSATRNNDTNEELFNLGQLVAAGELTRQEAEDALALAASKAGLPAYEIRKLLRDNENSGMNRGIASGPRDLTKIQSREPALTLVPPPPDPPTLDYQDAEDGFWTSRKTLQDIYIAALSRMCSPWAVLACCAARALAQVRPGVTLPDIIGGPGSLNWFGAVTAVSGGGKGAASATAKQLVNEFVQQRNTGSGEGIIRAYVRPKDGDIPAGLHEALMFMVDEIDSLTAQAKRSGATTMSVLRSAFSGETLGFSYVNNNTPTIDAHTYRMTMIVSVQPSRATDLLADVGGGTPQRFMWFPGTDNRIAADMAGGYVPQLTLPSPREWLYPRTIDIPLQARELILRERVKAMQGKLDALDGHALFVREKFAFALAVLDGRAYVTEEDWQLSGVAAKVSDTTRDWVAATVREAVDEEATEKGRLQGVSSVAANDERDWRTDVKRARVTELIVRHFTRAGESGLSERQERQALGREGKWFGVIAGQLADQGVLRYDDAEKRWYIT